MDFEEFYKNNDTQVEVVDQRLAQVVELTRKYRPESILDVGCGRGVLLNELRRVHPDIHLGGTDVAPLDADEWDHRVSDVTKRVEFEDASFDMVILGEIIEHVPDPDFLLAEAHRVLLPGGIIIVTTPNLVSWANRFLVLSGTQPLFTETSTKMNLGRRAPMMGQGGKVQGHLKIFTHHSLREIMELSGFEVAEEIGTTFFFPFPASFIDKAASRFPSVASGLIYVGRRTSSPVNGSVRAVAAASMA